MARPHLGILTGVTTDMAALFRRLKGNGRRLAADGSAGDV
jgi:hypothetical protein